MEKVLFLLGPTAVGKSKLAVKLAQKFDGEVISADSVAIYKGFDIGSAKITRFEMNNIPHHLIDICSPKEYFSVSDFVEITRKKINEITSRKKLPIIVGGTGLYISALLGGYNFGCTDKHDDFRDEIKKQIETEGHQAVWEKLNSINPEIAVKIEPKNTNRLIRGFEIATFGQKQAKSELQYDYLLFSLNLDRAVLYERINARVDIMLKNGLIEEVRNLINNGVKKDSQPMKAIGYKEVVEYLDNVIDEKTMLEAIKQHSRNYAKRQLTYLRGLSKQYNLQEINAEQAEENIIKRVELWLN